MKFGTIDYVTILGGQNPQKLSKIGPNRHFPAKYALSENHNISVISERIIMPLAGKI